MHVCVCYMCVWKCLQNYVFHIWLFTHMWWHTSTFRIRSRKCKLVEVSKFVEVIHKFIIHNYSYIAQINPLSSNPLNYSLQVGKSGIIISTSAGSCLNFFAMVQFRNWSVYTRSVHNICLYSKQLRKVGYKAKKKKSSYKVIRKIEYVIEFEEWQDECLSITARSPSELTECFNS